MVRLRSRLSLRSLTARGTELLLGHRSNVDGRRTLVYLVQLRGNDVEDLADVLARLGATLHRGQRPQRLCQLLHGTEVDDVIHNTEIQLVSHYENGDVAFGDAQVVMNLVHPELNVPERLLVLDTVHKYDGVGFLVVSMCHCLISFLTCMGERDEKRHRNLWQKITR